MFAITLDENKYLKSYSDKVRTPGSILVESIPDESDAEKLRCYQYIKKKFVLDVDKWAAIEAEREERARFNGITHEIAAMKEKIASTDYQIIKCYEYALNNLDLPYDVAALHAERQALRNRINDLEKQLNA